MNNINIRKIANGYIIAVDKIVQEIIQAQKQLRNTYKEYYVKDKKELLEKLKEILKEK